MNVYFEFMVKDKDLPRLSIIFEFEEEAKKFKKKAGFQTSIKKKL